MELQVTVENRNYSSDYLNLFLQAVPKESTPEKKLLSFKVRIPACREKLPCQKPGRSERP